MANERVKVGIANEKEKNLDIEEVKKWEPKNVNHMGDTTVFKHDGTYYSMKRTDYSRIFNN